MFTVIIQTGGNDLSPLPGKKALPTADIAKSIIEVGTVCKQFDAQHVLIGGVTTRSKEYEQRRCQELNEVLEGMCKLNGFTFIDNSTITTEHLYDGVHLNNNGSKVLADNYLNALWKVRQS